MDFSFSGWFKPKNQKKAEEDLTQDLEISNDDGAIEINGSIGESLSMEIEYNDQADLIQMYREVAEVPEVEGAIDEIVNEAVNSLSSEKVVEINLQETDLSESIKSKISDEFDQILKLLKFQNTAHTHFREWYIDGRKHYQKIIDPKNPKKGILRIRKLDSKNVKLIREIQRDDSQKIVGLNEYYVYKVNINESTGGNYYYPTNPEPMIIPKEAITFIHSRQTCPKKGYIISRLHKALKPSNQLSMLENAMVISRVVRAPERRVFYIDVGSLPKQKAEAYMQGVIKSNKRKIVYDSITGKTKDSTHVMSMSEDYFLPRREGGKGTQVDTVGGNEKLSDMQDVLYFVKRLYRALSVPMSRFEDNGGIINFGNIAEMDREELKFNKLINRLRFDFNELYIDLLKTQLTLKNIINDDEWEDIKDDIKFDYAQDFYVTEQKEMSTLEKQLELLDQIDQFRGEYFTKDQIMKRVLKLSDEEIKELENTDDEPSLDSEEEPKNKPNKEDYDQKDKDDK